jgi:hypothetical protein
MTPEIATLCQKFSYSEPPANVAYYFDPETGKANSDNILKNEDIALSVLSKHYGVSLKILRLFSERRIPKESNLARKTRLRLCAIALTFLTWVHKQSQKLEQ